MPRSDLFYPLKQPFPSAVWGLKVWHEVLRIVELLLVLSVVLVDDILEDGLDAGIDLPWWLIIDAVCGQAAA